MIRIAAAIAALLSPPAPRRPVALALAHPDWEVQRPRHVPDVLPGFEWSGDSGGRGAVDDDFDGDDEQFEVSLHNGLPDMEIDFVQVIEVDGEEVWDMQFDQVVSGEATSFLAYEGDVLLALRSGTEDVVAVIEIDPGQTTYSIFQTERSEDPLDYLEPDVQRHAVVLPPSVCEQLIELGEKTGFIIDEDSIDVEEQNDPNQKFIPALTTDVYKSSNHPDTEGVNTVGDEAIWEVLQPWIPRITQIVKDNRNQEETRKLYPDEPGRDPELDWVFFRKYSPEEDRISLKHHHDTNVNTVNIELSDDYEGGGLFYIKPLVSTGQIAQEYFGYGYEWVNTLERENTTDIVFPDLHAGDAILYNYTVEHGIAPVKSGKRYSMAFFFDMNNPAVSTDFEWRLGLEDDDEDELDDDELEVKIHNGFADVALDIVQVLNVEDGEEVLEKKMVLEGDESGTFYGYEGDSLRALFAGTDKVVSDIVVRPDRNRFTISPSEPLHSEL